MEKRAQVFVSSTYVDLVEERQAVTKTLLELDCFPAGMELFPAGDDDKWELIQGVIDDSDYYVLILSGKYGSIDEQTDVSFTEMEYDYAVSLKKPVLAFIRKDLTSLPVKESETDPERRKKLEAFHDKVKAKRNVKFFSSKEELAAALATSLTPTIRKYPAVGWVRGDNAMTPETRTEIAELKASLAEAQQAQKLESQPLFDDLADGEDEFEYAGEVVYEATDDKRYRGHFTFSTTWNAVFRELGPLLLHETTERQLMIRLEDVLTTMAYAQASEIQPTFLVGNNFDFSARDELDNMLVQFLALRLIERGTQRRGVSDRERYWKLTDQGEDRLMAMRAVRRTSPEGSD